MKLTVSRENLMKALGWVQNVVEKRSTMPVLSHALIRAQKDGLVMIATNLQMVVEGQVDAEVEQPGSLTLNAKRLLDIVRALPDGDIVIESDDKNRAEIRGERGVFHIMGLNESEFPPFPEYGDVPFVEVEAGIIKSMVDRTIFAASLEESRYNLQGILMQVVEKFEGDEDSEKSLGKVLRMVATDGHRLCLVDREVEDPEKLKLDEGLILPRRGLNELKKILGDSEDVEKVGFGVSDNDAVFRVGSVVIIMRTLQGSYPNYDRVIPKDNDRVIVANRMRMLESLGRVSIISDEKTRGIKLTVSPGKVVVESQNPEVGDAREELEVETDIEDIEIGYNAKYLLEALGAMDTEEIELMLKDGVSSGIFRPKEDNNYVCVVMPMRL